MALASDMCLFGCFVCCGPADNTYIIGNCIEGLCVCLPLESLTFYISSALHNRTIVIIACVVVLLLSLKCPIMCWQSINATFSQLESSFPIDNYWP